MKQLQQARNKKLKKFELGGGGLSATPTFKTNNTKLLDSNGIDFGFNSNGKINVNSLGKNGGFKDAVSSIDGSNNVLGDAANSMPVVDPITGAIKVAGVIDSISSGLAKKNDGTYKSKTAEVLDSNLNPLAKPKALLEGFQTGNYEGFKRSVSFGMWGGESAAEAAVRKQKEEQTKLERETSINAAKLAGQNQQIQGNNSTTMFKRGGNIFNKNNTKNEVSLTNTKFINNQIKKDTQGQDFDDYFGKPMSSKFVDSKTSLNFSKTINNSQDNEVYLTGSVGAEHGYKSNPDYFRNDETADYYKSKGKTGLDVHSYRRKPSQEYTSPTFNVGVGVKTKENNKTVLDGNIKGEIGVDYSNDNLAPYATVNPSVKLLLGTPRKNFGYLKPEINLKGRYPTKENSYNFTYDDYGDKKVIKDIDSKSDNANELTTKSIDGSIGVNVGKDFKNNLSIEGTYKKHGVGDNSFGAKVKYKFAEGGDINNPEYEVEKNEVVQGTDTNLEEQTDLASDMTLAGGETHENGGTQGEGGERVFSHRIEIGKPLLSFLSANKISVKPNSTYAEVAAKLGRLKGKYEKNTKSNDSLKHKTATTMTQRIDGLIEAAFQEQEINKQQNDVGTKMFKRGGKLPKLFGGGYPVNEEEPPKKIKYMYDYLNNNNNTNKLSNQEEIINSKSVYPFSVNTEIQPRVAKSLPVNSNLTVPTLEKTQAANLNLAAKNNNSSTDSSSSNKSDKEVSFKDADTNQLLNAAVYLKNLNLINSQETGIKRKTATPLLLRNNNFSASANNEIDKTVNTASKAMSRNSSSYQDIYARNADLVSRGIEGKNKVAEAQANSDINIANQNTSMINDYNKRANENFNADAIDKVINKNAIIANKSNALNTFLQGVMGNIASKRAYSVEKEKLAIAKIYAGNRGTDTRSIAKFKALYDKGELTKSEAEDLGVVFKKGGVLPKKVKSYC